MNAYKVSFGKAYYVVANSEKEALDKSFKGKVYYTTAITQVEEIDPIDILCCLEDEDE